MQETETTLDPQRQYAQLLALWAQGNKVLRRQFNGQAHTRSLEAWQLGQSIASHGIGVLPMQLNPVIFFIADDPDDVNAWCVLVDETLNSQREWFRRPIWLSWDNRWQYNGTWTLPAAFMARLGKRQWQTLRQYVEGHADSVVWHTHGDVQDVLAGLRHEPRRIGQAPAALWLPLAQLWRHRGSWRQVALDPTDHLPWLEYDANTDKFLWPRTKDEDSVQ
ncbi:hypothetical protein BXT84_02140 [Sulfobacillus thermotolerans]|uniref:DUF4262 domain-containing protein n=1 Tax=Sulfobacillus thermotolerans TaxID=338644 RepID=A0ABM6RNI2_9FIRM|nr:hypothetical protein BXT84_02140 [Sulfobacillus thermotolerans]